MAPTSALPIGETRKLDPAKCTKIDPTPELSHMILGVSAATKESEIQDANILGYFTVQEVDLAGRKITVLSPHPKKLQKALLLKGNLHYSE